MSNELIGFDEQIKICVRNSDSEYSDSEYLSEIYFALNELNTVY